MPGSVHPSGRILSQEVIEVHFLLQVSVYTLLILSLRRLLIDWLD